MFSPHHRFANCQRLERMISDLRQRGTVTADVFQNHNRYHYALIHKLKSARDNLTRLSSVLNDTPPEEAFGDSAEFLYSVNSCIDGFFYAGGSALDILAREVLTYFAIPLTGNIYYRTAHERLTASRPGDQLITKLVDPNWKEEFSNYRNALTHEVLVADSFSIKVEVDGSTQRTKIVFPLPDDPRADPNHRSFRRNENVLVYCEATFRRALSLINQVYGDLGLRIQTNGSLPL